MLNRIKGFLRNRSDEKQRKLVNQLIRDFVVPTLNNPSIAETLLQMTCAAHLALLDGKLKEAKETLGRIERLLCGAINEVG